MAHWMRDLVATARAAEQQLRNRMSLETMLAQPNILAWQEAYRKFGVKPNKHKPTCEALLRRILKGDTLPTINTIVNCYLIAEMEHLLPCGGYDIDRVRGDIELRISNVTRHLLQSEEPKQKKPTPGKLYMVIMAAS